MASIVIKTELLRGAENKKEFDHLFPMLKGLAYPAVAEDFCERLSDFSFNH